MERKIARMKELLSERLPREALMETGINGVAIFRRDTPYGKRSQLYNSQIILLAQGKKNIYLGDKKYVYDPYHYFVQTVPLPIQCEAIIEDGKPMLGIVLRIAPQLIGEILSGLDTHPPANANECASLYDASMTEEIVDAAIRLLECLDSKNETRILGQVFLKEILFRILTGENGEALRELAMSNRGFYQVAKAINKIHEDYSRPIEIQTLAREAGMSSTAFYAMFKSVTSTSPLQYIKNIRLHKAKELIQQEGEKAYEAALRVGYESASQFSREYKRCFGAPPAKDRQIVSAY